jgi:tetratricopeptide (TPR) repeat protein
MKRLIVIFAIAANLLSYAKNPINYYANKAEESINLQRYEDALDYARQEIIDYESNPNGYYQAGISLLALQQPGQSLTMLNKAIDYAKKDKEIAANSCLAKSAVLFEMGDSIQGISALSDGLKRSPNNVNLLLERARILTVSDAKTAIKDLQKAKKLAPNDARVYVYTAYLYSVTKQYQEALEEITQAIALDKTSAYSYALRGLISKELGYSPDWIKDCLRSVELEKEVGLGTSLLINAESENERSEIIRIIEENRTTENGFYTLEANLLYTWGMYLDAAKVYDTIINLGIHESDTYYFLAECQKNLGFIINAYTTVSLGMNKYPNDASLKFTKAKIGIDVGKGLEVEHILKSLIAEYPEMPNVYFELGRAYMSKGLYSKACEPLYSAILLEPSAINKMLYADALRLSGQSEKANKIYNDILQMSQTEIIEQGGVPQVMFALAYSGLGNKAQAVKTISELDEIIPSGSVSFLPMIYARLDAKADAVQAFKEYVKVNKWNALLDVYTYNYHNLHTEQEFVNLLAENNVQTRLNQETNLLEYVPKAINISSGGTSLEEAMSKLNNNTEDWVESINKLCPIDMGFLGQVISVGFDKKTNTAEYNYVTAPGAIDYELINNNPVLRKKKEDVIALGLLFDSPEIIDSGVAFKYNFMSKEGDEHCSFLFSNQRLKELYQKSKSQDEVDRMRLELWVEEQKLSMHRNSLTRNVSVEFDGSCISYIYPTSETDGSFSSIELFRSEQKSRIMGLFKDPVISQYTPALVRQNITVKFIYKGDISGRTVEISFTPEELSQFL